MRDALASTLYELARVDPRVVVLVADISPAGAMGAFRRDFPGRFYNVGVAEQAMIGLAAGLATRGFRPVCYTIATFALFRPYEFIRDDLAYQDLPVLVVGMGAGLSYSTLGGTHQAVEDVAVAAACPNLTVLAPTDPHETVECTRWALGRESGGPVYMRIGKAGEPHVGGVEQWRPHRLRLVRYTTPYTDLLVVSYGPVASEALVAARRLDADMISVATLRPTPPGLPGFVGRYKRVVVVEEASGGPLAAALSMLGLRVESIALPRSFPHAQGTRAELLHHFGLSADRIVDEVRRS